MCKNPNKDAIASANKLLISLLSTTSTTAKTHAWMEISIQRLGLAKDPLGSAKREDS